MGDLYAIHFPDNSFAYGRVLQEVSAAFYKHRTENIKDLPTKEEYEFTISVHRSCFREWVFIENRPFANPADSRSPCYQMKDIFTGKYSIYDFGEIRPATEEECRHLEICAICENAHIIDSVDVDPAEYRRKLIQKLSKEMRPCLVG